MIAGKHYGVIPGTKNNTLYKAGAEKLCALFRLGRHMSSEERYDGAKLTVKAKCMLYYHGTGKEVGEAEAICSSEESKFLGVKTPDDRYHMVFQRAHKRAFVNAVLVTTGASDLFMEEKEK